MYNSITEGKYIAVRKRYTIEFTFSKIPKDNKYLQFQFKNPVKELLTFISLGNLSIFSERKVTFVNCGDLNCSA